MKVECIAAAILILVLGTPMFAQPVDARPATARPVDADMKMLGVCPPDSPCWDYISRAFFENCCPPYTTVTRPSRGKGYLPLAERDFERYKAPTVLYSATLMTSARRDDVRRLLGERGQTHAMPWYLGPFDRIGITTLLAALDALGEDQRKTVREVVPLIAEGGEFRMVILTWKNGGAKWAQKGLVYEVDVGNERRSAWLGGVRFQVYIED